MQMSWTGAIAKGGGFLCFNKRTGGCKLPEGFNDDEPRANFQIRSDALFQ
jgi:hypothetical protein